MILCSLIANICKQRAGKGGVAGGGALPKTTILPSYWQTDQGLRASSAGPGGASPPQFGWGKRSAKGPNKPQPVS